MNNHLAYRLAHACWISLDKTKVQECMDEISRLCDGDHFSCSFKSYSFNRSINNYKNLINEGFRPNRNPSWPSVDMDFSVWVSVVLTEKMLTEKFDEKLKSLNEELIGEFFSPGNNGAIKAEEEFKNILKQT